MASIPGGHHHLEGMDGLRGFCQLGLPRPMAANWIQRSEGLALSSHKCFSLAETELAWGRGEKGQCSPGQPGAVDGTMARRAPTAGSSLGAECSLGAGCCALGVMGPPRASLIATQGERSVISLSS